MGLCRIHTLVCLLISFVAGCSTPDDRLTPIVEPGSQSIKNLNLQPFIAEYRNLDRDGNEIGTITTQLNVPGGANTDPIEWLCTIETGRGTVVDSIAFDRRTFAPVYRSFPHSKKGYHYLNIDDGTVTGRIDPPLGQSQPLSIQLDRSFFEVSLLDFALAALPLEPGYKVRFPYGDYNQKAIAWAVAEVDGRK